MSVLLVSPNYLPTVGGAELAVHQLALALHRAGQRPALLCANLGPLPEGIPFPVWRYPIPRRGGRRAHQVVLRAALLLTLARRRVDLIHAHYCDSAGWAAVQTRGLHRRAVIVTSHGADLQLDSAIAYGLRQDPRVDRCVRRTLSRADACVAISDELATDMVRAGARPSAVARIANGVDLAWVQRWAEESRSQRLARMVNQAPEPCAAAKGRFFEPPDWDPGSVRHSPLRIIATGRNHPKKGFAVLLKAMRYLSEKHPRLRLCIVGENSAPLAASPDGRALGDRLELPGRLPPQGTPVAAEHPLHPDLARALGAADVFCSPSLIEGFPLANVEAMAAGLPLVLTDTSGNRDVIKGNGLLVPSREPRALAAALDRLLSDSALRTAMAERSRALARRYDWSEIAQEHAKLYEQVLRARRKRGSA